MKIIKIYIFLLLSVFLYAKSVYHTFEKSNNEICFTLNNTNLFDITYKVDANYSNLYSLQTLPLEGIIPEKSKKCVAKFFMTGQKYTLSPQYKWVVGSKNVFHNNLYKYRLPYKLGTTEYVTQGFNGVFSHKGNSKYAVDFGLKVGSKVYASRNGIVVMLKKDSKRGGIKKEYYDDANFIMIKHDDGTFAKYVHLSYNGVVVKVGQYVKRGELIGYSGNTGYTNGPHLHFIVFKGYNTKRRIPIKIKFIAKEGIITNPKKGMKLTAVK